MNNHDPKGKTSTTNQAKPEGRHPAYSGSHRAGSQCRRLAHFHVSRRSAHTSALADSFHILGTCPVCSPLLGEHGFEALVGHNADDALLRDAHCRTWLFGYLR